MVLDPAALAQIARQAALTAPADSGQEGPRAYQAQLSFSAMLSAVQSRCECEACQLLREAVDTMRVRPKQEVANRGPDNTPQT